MKIMTTTWQVGSQKVAMLIPTLRVSIISEIQFLQSLTLRLNLVCMSWLEKLDFETNYALLSMAKLLKIWKRHAHLQYKNY